MGSGAHRLYKLQLLDRLEIQDVVWEVDRGVPTGKECSQVDGQEHGSAGFRKRCVGRIVTSLKNAIGSLCPICDPNPQNQKGNFKQVN